MKFCQEQVFLWWLLGVGGGLLPRFSDIVFYDWQPWKSESFFVHYLSTMKLLPYVIQVVGDQLIFSQKSENLPLKWKGK